MHVVVDSSSIAGRDWRASMNFTELCGKIGEAEIDTVYGTRLMLKAIAAKLDDMLPRSAPPAAPEPINRAERPAGCIFPKCGCRDGFCGGAYDGGPSMPTPPAPVKARWSDDGRLYEAARAIYGAAHWYTPTLASNEQLKLWTELRDALGLKAGAPNKVGHAVTNTPRFPFPRD